MLGGVGRHDKAKILLVETDASVLWYLSFLPSPDQPLSLLVACAQMRVNTRRLEWFLFSPRTHIYPYGHTRYVGHTITMVLFRPCVNSAGLTVDGEWLSADCCNSRIGGS
jgi:hypothetical protein